MSQRYSCGPIHGASRRGKRLAVILATVGIVAGCLVIRYFWGADSANAEPASRPAARPKTTAPTAPARAAAGGDVATLKVFASVNGRPISRDELGRECLRHYGKEVLESLVNKLLIAEECQRLQIVVSRTDVDTEIKRMAKRFKLPVDQWMKLLQEERGINPTQYASDIIWPTLALRRLAGEHLQVTEKELVELFEMKYGPAVDARLISCKDPAKAQRARAEAAADPASFGSVARKYSDDASAGLEGRIQPIRKNGSYPEIEQAAFTMADGEVSQVIPAGGQFVVIQRKRLLPGSRYVKFESVRPQMEELIRDSKLRHVAGEVFQKLQTQSKVVNVFNDPAKRRQTPGVAAIINGRQITVSQLAEQCIQRHGAEVLDGVISRAMIEQACRKGKIEITDAEIDAEIAREASISVPQMKDGSPDLEAYLKLATEKSGISEDVYRHDVVWPTVALKKLAGGNVEVTEEDIRKGIEANYGPRVRCLAIVMNNLRRATEVYEKARDNPTPEFFGELAEQYSIDSSTRVLRGVVPPIQRHGGQGLMEKKAFSLKPNEISGIIQVEDRFIILYCLGQTKPTVVDPEQVRPLIYEDIFEKKQHLAMAKYFELLQESATIDNHLTGTKQRPKPPARAPAPGRVSASRAPLRR
ncbi:MAG: peptidylprolyl isomerase [Candidatus Nealsonbacteria bacterium]|nr:peptidylprolyl isomerase [Candidatus Nealsonbacteria bacterium]